MDLRKTMKYAGLCAGVAFTALGASEASAVGPWSDDGTLTFTVVEPTATPTAGDVDFGDVGVISTNANVAKLTINADDGTVDETAAGVAPNTRFFKVDYSTADVLTFEVAGGVAGEQMSVTIGNADANNANAVTGVPVTLSNANSNSTFVVDTWTCGIPDGGANFKGAAAGGGNGGTKEALAGWSSANGTGTLTLGWDGANALINNGVAKIACGMTISTDGGGNGYASGAYTGSVRFIVDYL